MSEYVQCGNCDRPAKYRRLKLCARCYQRFKAHGDFDLHTRQREKCLVGDCDDWVKAYGFCRKHWDRIQKYGEAEDRKWSRRDTAGCSVPQCGGRHRAMGLCDRHYSAEQKRGHPLWRTPGRRKIHGDRPWTPETVADIRHLIEWLERQQAR